MSAGTFCILNATATRSRSLSAPKHTAARFVFWPGASLRRFAPPADLQAATARRIGGRVVEEMGRGCKVERTKDTSKPAQAFHAIIYCFSKYIQQDSVYLLQDACSCHKQHNRYQLLAQQFQLLHFENLASALRLLPPGQAYQEQSAPQECL